MPKIALEPLQDLARRALLRASANPAMGESIPLGWALDRDGNPTTDPQRGLEGSVLPLGGAKGAMLALVVELLVRALTGAALGFEATSFFVDEGSRPRLAKRFW